MGDLDEMLEHYKSLPIRDESTLVVRGASVQEVVDALGGVPLDDVPKDELDGDEPIWATYMLTAIEGGVLASEDTGYADPPNSVLVALSKDGRAAAVVRNNIQAHCRFGCARDGALLFDSDEYTFLEDRDSVPQEVRALFDLAWVDLTEDEFDPQEDDSTAVGLAMAEVVTGIHLTSADAANLEGDDATVVAVRQLQYASEKGDPQLLSIAEAVEGLAASQRVGRDVDGTPDARPLSGQLGSVQVQRTVRGTRRKMFLVVAHVTSWSGCVAEGSWMFGGGGGETYALDQPSYGWAGNHADQLSGSAGSIVDWFIEVDRPRRAVRGWNWGVPIPGRPGWEPAMFLPVDTQVTATLDENGDETGSRWTTVTINHDHLPVEWIDDLHAWWSMQLAILEALQEAEARKK